MADQIKKYYFDKKERGSNGLPISMAFTVVLFSFISVLQDVPVILVIKVALVLLIIIGIVSFIFKKALCLISIDLAEKTISFQYSYLNGKKSIKVYHVKEIEATYLLEDSYSTKKSLNEEVLKIKKENKIVIKLTTGRRFSKDVISEIYNHIFMMKRELKD